MGLVEEISLVKKSQIMLPEIVFTCIWKSIAGNSCSLYLKKIERVGGGGEKTLSLGELFILTCVNLYHTFS